MKKSKTILKITSITILILSICCVLVALGSLFFGITTATSFTEENSVSISQQAVKSIQTSSDLSSAINNTSNSMGIAMFVFAVIGFVLFIFGMKCVKGSSYKHAFILGTTFLLLSCFYCVYSFENINIFNVIPIILLGLYTRCAYGVKISYNNEN
jgi:TRAP-type mannitol/chloroaromatic compound transport system permease large subunit